MLKTAKLQLNKPEGDEYVDIDVLNANMDILDNEVTKLATPSVDGRMAKEDKSKLNGIEAGANKYVHPSTHPASIIAQDANNRFMTDVERSKLNGIEAGAQKNIVTSVAGKTGAVTVTKTDVGLSNVDNVKQASKTEFDVHVNDSKPHVIILTDISPDAPPNSYPHGFSMAYFGNADSFFDAWVDVAISLLRRTTDRFLRCAIQTYRPNTINGVNQKLTIYSSASGSAGNILGVFERAAYSNAIGWRPFVKTDANIVIDRTDITVDSPPSAYPDGNSMFGETRAATTPDWLVAMGATLWSSYRLVVETDIALGRTGPFQVHRQRVTYYTNGASAPGYLRGIYERFSFVNDDGETVWGDFSAIMTEKGGQFTDIVKAHPNTSYTVAQMRNAIFLKDEPTDDIGDDGDFCVVYADE